MNRKTISRWVRLVAAWLMLGLVAAALAMPVASVAAVTTSNPPTSTTVDPVKVTWLTFGLDRIEMLRGEVMGNPIWQYVSALLYLVVAFYVSKLLDYTLQVQLRKWAARTRNRLDELTLNLLHGPVKVVCFVVLLHVGLGLFSWPDRESALIAGILKIVVAGMQCVSRS